MMANRWFQVVVVLVVVATGYRFWSKNIAPKSVKLLEFSSGFANSKRQIASEEKEKVSVSTHMSELDKHLIDITKTKACYSSHDCPFDQADPRAYDFAVGELLASQIKSTHQKFKNDPNARMSLKSLGIEFFKSENGFVQEAALDILRDFPNDEETFAALNEGLKESYNPLIVEMSLPELEKYMGTQKEDEVHNTLTDLMYGAHFASQAVTQNILSFINPHSYDHYKTVLAQLNPQTQAYRDLKSALKEYEKRQSGG